MILSMLAIAHACEKLSSLPLDVSVEEVTSVVAGLRQEEQAQCLIFAFQRGVFEAAEGLNLSAFSTPHKDRIKQVLKQKVAYLSRLLEQPESQQPVQVTPVIKWHQSETHLAFILKTSHRWDSPPCTKLTREDVFKQESGRVVVFDSECMMSGRIFSYRLKLRLLGEMKQMRFYKEGQGIYLARGQKEKSEMWTSLTDGNQSSLVIDKDYEIELTPK